MSPLNAHFRCTFYSFLSDLPEKGILSRYVLIREVELQSGIRDPLCVSTYLLLSSLKPVAFPRTTTQDWKMKGGKQQGRQNNGQLWQPSGNSEMTQRVSRRSVAFPQPQRELAPAGLDCQTCRDAYWLTHCRQGVELGGRGMNRSDNSQRHGMGHGDGCCKLDGWRRVSELTWPCEKWWSYFLFSYTARNSLDCPVITIIVKLCFTLHVEVMCAWGCILYLKSLCNSKNTRAKA